MPQAIQSPIARGNTEDNLYYVLLKVHILRQNNEGVAISESRVLEHIMATIKHFLVAGLQFYLVGDFNYIDLDQAFYLKYDKQHNLTKTTANYKEEEVFNLLQSESSSEIASLNS